MKSIFKKSKLVAICLCSLLSLGSLEAEQYEIIGLLPSYDNQYYFRYFDLNLNDRGEGVLGSFYLGENRGFLDYSSSEVYGYTALNNITNEGALVGSLSFRSGLLNVYTSPRLGPDFLIYPGLGGVTEDDFDEPLFALDDKNAIGACYYNGAGGFYYSSSACGYINGTLRFFNLSLGGYGENQRYLPQWPQRANAVNKSGTVVGQAVKNYDSNTLYPNNETNQMRAFSWTEGGGIVDLGTLGGKNSYALDVNEAGTIVGYAEKFFSDPDFTNSPERSFVKKQDGGLVEIDIPGQLDSRANALNDAGLIVGTVRFSEEESKAYMKKGENPAQLLSDLVHPAFKNVTLVTATDINNSAEVIGATDTFPYSAYMARVTPTELRPIPFTGARDKVGTADYLVWRPENGTWYSLRPRYSNEQGRFLFNSSDVLVKQWGLPGDVPIFNADFDGDKLDDLTVWRPSTGMWYICHSSTSYDCTNPSVQQFGLSGDIPLVADFDKDGKSDFVVYRRSLPSAGIVGRWYIKGSKDGVISSKQWGLVEDFPVPGDYNGDGYADFAVYRPSSASWFVQYSNQGAGNPTIIYKQFGLPNDHPMPRDVDSDGILDLVVYRPENAYWFSCLSSRQFSCFKGDGTLSVPAYQFGLPGDYPILRNTIGGSTIPYAVWRKRGITNSEGTWFTDIPVGAQEISLKTFNWGLLSDIPAGIGIRDLVGKVIRK